MTAPYDVSDEAGRDLERIWEHYAARASIRVADETLKHIETIINRTIAKHARSGRPRAEFGSLVRSFPVAPYVIFDRVVGRRVEILRILHTHRDIHPPLMSMLAAV